MPREPWWKKSGIRFECQGSGRCCVSRDSYGFVYLTNKDRANLAKAIGISTSAFTRTMCEKTDGIYHLKSDNGPCVFLKNKRCTVYEARPMQCKTWPFWPEVMNPKSWSAEVAKFCPGVGKGKLWSPEEIQKELTIQSRWEDELGS